MSGTYNATIRRGGGFRPDRNPLNIMIFYYTALKSAGIWPAFFPAVLIATPAFRQFYGIYPRPLGALFWQQGDTLKRKNTLLILGGMGAVTLHRLLPPVLARWRLLYWLFLRFRQGFMVGGEWGGAKVLMVVEYAAGKHRGVRLSAIANRRTHGTIIGDRRIYSRTQLPKRRCYRGDGVFLSAQCAFGVARLYMRHRLDETCLSSVRLKAQAINHRQKREEKAGGQSTRTMAQHLLMAILRFMESVPFFLPSSRFPGDNAVWDCQPDYSVHCTFTCSLAYPMHVLLASCRIGVAAVRCILRRAFVVRQWLFPFSGRWKAVRSYCRG